MPKLKLAMFGMLLIGSMTIVGQNAPIKTLPVPDITKTPKSAPVIADSLKLKFFKAQLESQAASEQARAAATMAQQKQVILQGIVKEIETVCGEKFQPQMDKGGDPICATSPKDAPPVPAAHNTPK